MVEEQGWQMSFSLQPHQHTNGHLHLWIQLHPWPTQFRKGFVFLGLVLFTAAWPRQRVQQQLSAAQALPSVRSPVKHLVTRQGQTGLKWERATDSAHWDAASWEKNRLFWVCWRIWLGKGKRRRNMLQKSCRIKRLVVLLVKNQDHPSCHMNSWVLFSRNSSCSQTEIHLFKSFIYTYFQCMYMNSSIPHYPGIISDTHLRPSHSVLSNFHLSQGTGAGRIKTDLTCSTL